MAELESKGLLIREYSAADINADPARIGFPGSPTKVKNVQSVILTASEAKSVPATADGIAELMHELISDHTLG
jgi:electron transfer flavoprotein beta subunit